MLSNFNYQQVIDFVVKSGKRIASKSGKIIDVGILKKYVTEEDLQIEREFKLLVNSFGHTLYAEEENFNFKDNLDLWIMDPISGTRTFIKGLPHYAIVVSHIHNTNIVFSTVYDPSVDELFIAEKNSGSYLNNVQIHVSPECDQRPSILINQSSDWAVTEIAKSIWTQVGNYASLYRNTNSFAVNYCYVASGRFDGVITLSKDTYPEFAGSLISREAGGLFTNIRGESQFLHTDRIFISGNMKIHSELIKIISPLLLNNPES